MAKKGLPIVAIVATAAITTFVIFLAHRQGVINFRHTTASDQGGTRPHDRHFGLSPGNFG